MKVVDYQTSADGREKSGALGRLVSGLSSLHSQTVPRAQETIIQTLKKVLDNRFILLRGLILPGLEPPAPLILVGPPGIWLIDAIPIKGVYRALDDQWEEMDSQTQKFRPARVNLPARTASIAQGVTAFVSSRGPAIQAIEPVIIFTQPGAHVEAVRSPARLVQSDAIVRFAASLLQGQIVLAAEDVQAVIDALKEPTSVPIPAQVEMAQDAFAQTEGSPQISPSKKEILPSQLSAALNTSEPEIIKRLSRRAAFTSRQWLILAALLAVNILVFIAIIVVVLIIT